MLHLYRVTAVAATQQAPDSVVGTLWAAFAFHMDTMRHQRGWELSPLLNLLLLSSYTYALSSIFSTLAFP